MSSKYPPPIDPTVYLTRTDTAIGFVSQNAERLDASKGRPAHKHYIRAVASLAILVRLTRVPPAQRNRLRRARKSTFVLPDGHAYRVVRDPHHLKLLRTLEWAYTTSANRSGEPYDEAWARTQADVIIEPLGTSGAPSSIYRLGWRTLRKLR